MRCYVATVALLALTASIATAAVAVASPGTLLATLALDATAVTPAIGAPYNNVLHRGVDGALAPILVMATASGVYGVRLDNHSFLWNNTDVNDWSGGSAVDAETNVLVTVTFSPTATLPIRIVCVDMATGAVVWGTDPFNYGAPWDFAISRRGNVPVLYYTNDGKTLFGAELRTGKAVYRASLANVTGNISDICVPESSSERIAVVTTGSAGGASVVAFVFSGTDGSLLSNVTFANTSVSTLNAQVGIKCVSVVSAATGKSRNIIFIAAPNSGTTFSGPLQISAYDMNELSFANPVIIGGGWLFVTQMWTSDLNGTKHLFVAAQLYIGGMTLFAIKCDDVKRNTAADFSVGNSEYFSATLVAASASLWALYTRVINGATDPVFMAEYTPFPAASSSNYKPVLNVTVDEGLSVASRTPLLPLGGPNGANQIAFGFFHRIQEAPMKLRIKFYSA